RDRVQQPGERDDRAPHEAIAPGDPAQGDRDHERDDDRDHALPEMLERELTDEAEVLQNPGHALLLATGSSVIAPCVRPSASTTTVPRAVSFRCSARLPFSAPMKLATK